MTPQRIAATTAHNHLESSGLALLVCAYDEDEKYHRYPLEGALPLSSFRGMEDLIPREREIIFYCA